MRKALPEHDFASPFHVDDSCDVDSAISVLGNRILHFECPRRSPVLFHFHINFVQCYEEHVRESANTSGEPWNWNHLNKRRYETKSSHNYAHSLVLHQ